MAPDLITASKGGIEVDPMENIQKDIVPHELPFPDELGDLSKEEVSKIEKSLVKRLDLTLMPVCVLLFLLNILDRNNIASAKIAGLQEWTNMTNNEYNTTLLMFYVGYCITQLPSNMIIGKVRPSYYICCVTSAWGVVSMCQGFVHNFVGLASARFILGLYTRKELPPRVAILYGGNMLATAFSGLIPDSQKPKYYAGGGVMSGACLVTACVALTLKYHLKMENKKLEDMERSGTLGGRYLRGSKAGHGGDAVLSFRYVH